MIKAIKEAYEASSKEVIWAAFTVVAMFTVYALVMFSYSIVFQ